MVDINIVVLDLAVNGLQSNARKEKGAVTEIGNSITYMSLLRGDAQ